MQERATMIVSAVKSHFGAKWHQNPFVSISQPTRILIVAYLIYWRVLPTLANLDMQNLTYAGYTGAICILNLCTEFLILLPFLIRSFLGTPIGWLHPLILPTMVGIALGLIRNPADLFTPILVWFNVTPTINHTLLNGWSDAAVLATQLKVNFINLLAIIATYIGFSMALSSRNILTDRQMHINGFKLGVLFVLCLFVVIFFLQKQGGIISHVLTLADGRFRMREMSGHFLVINGFLPYMIILWYAYQPKAFRNPIFLIGFMVAFALQFIVTGSRSALFITLAMTLAVWIFHNHRIPASRTIIVAMVSFLVLGVLGQIRQSGQSGVINFNALAELSITDAWEITTQELIARRTGTDLAVAALVPEQRDFLYGTTYVAALAFWVPRAVWHDKPRGAGAHAAALLYSERETMDDYRGGGFPVGGASEAYWNFGYLGVLIVFGLFGIVLSVISRWVCRDPRNPFTVVALLIVNFGLTTPSTTAIVPTLQTFLLLYLLRLLALR